MNKPNFFIAGAAKSGTSTLWKLLKKHPDVFMPPDELDKEPAYFSPLKCRRTTEQYINLFQNAREFHKRVGEASTAYLTDPASAGNIKAFDPESKIIIILRNPADRAYSAYNWMVMEGYEYAWNFKQALKLEEKRTNRDIPNFWEPEYYWNYMYCGTGMYYEPIKRYIDLFHDNVLVVKFDDFVGSLQSEYDKICSFLNIETNSASLSAQNVSKSVYSPLIQFALRKISTKLNIYRIKNFNYKIQSKNKRDLLLQFGIRNQKPKRLNPDLKYRLLQKYKENLQMLSDLTGTDFAAWVDN